MSSLNIEASALPFDPARVRIIDAPGKSDGRKRRFGNGPCNNCDCGVFVCTLGQCARFTCMHSWNDHS